MKLTKLFSIFALIIALGFGLNSCEESTTGTDPVVIEKLAAPTNLMATSYDKESIMIKWNASADEGNANFVGYEIAVDGVVKKTGLTDGKHTFTIDSLSEGKHTVTVKALSENTAKKDHSTLATIEWAPAWRFTTNINDVPIRVSETASTLGSGLNIFDTDGKAPKQLKVASIDQWTLGLETKTEGKVNFGPAASLTEYASHMTGKTMKNVEISAPIVAASLNDVFDSQALSTKTFSPALVDLNSINATNSVVFVIKETIGSNVRYAKVLVKKATAGFLQGTAPERYLEMEVSYQNQLDLPYAKTK